MPQPVRPFSSRRVRTLGLFSLLLLILPFAALSQRMSEERGYDHKGGDYDSFRSSNVRDCRESCERDRRCQAYTYNLNTGMCYVKDEVRQIERARDMVTGSRERRSEDDDRGDRGGRGGWRDDRDVSTEEGYDYKGGDYHSFRAESPRTCRRECSRERECRAYTYNYRTEMCYLKDRVNTRQRASDMVTGTKDGNDGGGSWRQELTEERGYDYRGGDYRDFSTSGVSRCKAECRDDSRCEAYTFNLRTDTCYLKDRVGNYQRNQDTVTGVKSEAGGGRPWSEDLTEEEGYDYRGGDYDSFDAPSVSSCKSSCRRDDRCVAYSYNLRTDTCYLKDRVGSYQRNSDTVTGVKED